MADAAPTGNTATGPLGLSPEAFLSLGSMEGMYHDIVETTHKVDAPVRSVWSGYVAAAVTAGLAYAVLSQIDRPIVSSAILAILLGAVARNVLPLGAGIATGCKRIVKKGIPIAIVLMGAGLNLASIGDVGGAAVLIIVVCLAIAVAMGYRIGRWFGLSRETSLLIGAGTGICGNSAIVAVAPLVDAKDEDLVLSIGTVNLFGLIAMLACPVIGQLFGMSPTSFGVFAGTTIHAVPQVVAAGVAFDADAGTIATATKLLRVTLLAPMVMVLAVMYARRHATEVAASGKPVIHYARLVPWFVWGFVIMALLNTFGLIPTMQFASDSVLADGESNAVLPMADLFKNAAKILLTLAMAAIGLEINLRQLASVGGKAILVGGLATALLATVSVVLILLLM